jgi:adhesin HecA-like repeat protein
VRSNKVSVGRSSSLVSPPLTLLGPCRRGRFCVGSLTFSSPSDREASDLVEGVLELSGEAGGIVERGGLGTGEEAGELVEAIGLVGAGGVVRVEAGELVEASGLVGAGGVVRVESGGLVERGGLGTEEEAGELVEASGLVGAGGVVRVEAGGLDVT